jgi:hypothetical protein
VSHARAVADGRRGIPWTGTPRRGRYLVYFKMSRNFDGFFL